MRIKVLIRLLKDIRYLRFILKRYGDSLAKGKYYIHNSFRALTLDTPEAREKAQKYFDKSKKKSSVTSVAAFLNKTNYFYNRKKSTTNQYESIYIANNYDKVREAKLFSFKNQKMLTICTTLEDMQKQLTEYSVLGQAYQMPCVKANERYKNSLEVSLIDLKPIPSDKAALDSIAYATAKFSSGKKLQSASVGELISFAYENEEMNLMLEKIVKSIDRSLLDISIPLCMQHGDLSKDNLIYGESEGKTAFWWIDWEHAGERVFFYDYFFYIINSGLYYDTKSYECYMSGECDSALGDFFSQFGLVFDPDKRKDYFMIFAVIFLKERVCDKGSVTALKQYLDFIEAH